MIIALITLVIIAGDGKISTAPMPSPAACADAATFAMFGVTADQRAIDLDKWERWLREEEEWQKTKAAECAKTTPQNKLRCELDVLNSSIGYATMGSAEGLDTSKQFHGPDGSIRYLYEPKTAGCLP